LIAGPKTNINISTKKVNKLKNGFSMEKSLKTASAASVYSTYLRILFHHGSYKDKFRKVVS